MDLLEIKEKQHLRREEVAARLHALADARASHNELEFECGDLRITVHVPDEVAFKLEIETVTTNEGSRSNSPGERPSIGRSPRTDMSENGHEER